MSNFVLKLLHLLNIIQSNLNNYVGVLLNCLGRYMYTWTLPFKLTYLTNCRFKLDPSENSEDEFYLLRNGSIFAPYQLPPLKETGDYCMETFWSELNPAGITLPLICFSTPPIDEAGTSLTLIFYAVGELIHKLNTE